MRRLLLVLIFSICLHLLVLMVRFDRPGTEAIGTGLPVRLETTPSKRFLPRENLFTQPGPSRPKHPSLMAEKIKKKTSARKRVAATALAAVKPALSKSEDSGAEPLALKNPARTSDREPSRAKEDVAGKLSEPETLANTAPLPTIAKRPTKAQTGSKSGSDALPLRIEAIPRYAENPKPVYPDVARRRGWSGAVRLRVKVSKMGRVMGLFIERSSGYAVLDRAARKAVRRWRFLPARRAETAVSSEVVVPIVFRLPPAKVFN